MVVPAREPVVFAPMVRPTKVVSALALLALLISSAPARAQVLVGYLFGEKLASPTFNMGFEVGANFTNFAEYPNAERTHRPVFGLFADWRFSRRFHLGGSILPIATRGARGLAPVLTGDADFDVQLAGSSMKRNVSYVEIPVLLKWAPHREEGFRAGVGPSIGIVTGADDRYDVVTPGGTGYVLERDIGDQLPGLDLGLSVDVEWRFKMLSIAARYTHGFTDMSHDGSADPAYSRVLTGTGRIPLGKKPSS
jgi:hypothetical protein